MSPSRPSTEKNKRNTRAEMEIFVGIRPDLSRNAGVKNKNETSNDRNERRRKTLIFGAQNLKMTLIWDLYMKGGEGGRGEDQFPSKSFSFKETAAIATSTNREKR